MFEATSQYIAEEGMFHGFIPRIMGTRFDILLAGVSSALGESCWALTVTELQRLDKILNRFDATSEVSRLNGNAFKKPFVVSREFWDILNDCKKYHQMTSGIFDVTLKDFSLVKFHEETKSVSFSISDLSLDFGGYAKGYALEKIKGILKKQNIEHAFINFGNSSIMGIGKHPYGNGWKVNINNPFHPEKVLGEFTLKNAVLTTSGNTPDYTEHIIHPFSGKRNNEKKCICVITNNACDGEVLSTSLIASHQDKQKIITKFEPAKIIEYKFVN